MAKALKEAEKLRNWRNKFLQAWTAEKKWRREKKKWNRFYDGDQLSDDEKKVLSDRGQPEVISNRIKPKVDALVGMQIGLRVDTKAFAAGTGDFESAVHISQALKFTERRTNFDDHETEAFEEMLRTGRSWYKTVLRWDALEPETETEFVASDDIFKDPFSRRADLKDAKHVDESIWMDLVDALELWPDKEDDLRATLQEISTFPAILRDEFESLREFRPDQFQEPGNDIDATNFSANFDLFADQKRQRVRIIAHHFRTPMTKVFLSNPKTGTEEVTDFSKRDIKAMMKSFPQSQLWKQIGWKLNVGTYVWNAILEEKLDVRPWDEHAKYPLTMVQAWETKDPDSKMPFGIVKQLISPQEEINKRKSKSLHLLNTNQLIMEKGAVDNVNQARRELNKPDGLIIRNPEFSFEVQRNIDLAQSQLQLLQEAKEDIDRVGVGPEIQGLSKAKSGRDFQLRQQAATQPLRKLFKNLRAARKRVAELWLDDIQQFWTSERLVKVTDEPDALEVVLNKKITDPSTGETVILNNVSLGKYDIIVEEAPETLNLLSEQFDGLVQLASSGVPIPPDIIIEASALPNKKRVLKRMQEQQQLQAQLAAQQEGQVQ